LITDRELEQLLIDHRDKLKVIGTSHQLALHFQSQGLKAECRNPARCLIAESFRGALLEAEAIGQLLADGHELRMTVSQLGATTVIKTPNTRTTVAAACIFFRASEIGNFITFFDAGEYPDLVA
jgi:hypothetical protein